MLSAGSEFHTQAQHTVPDTEAVAVEVAPNFFHIRTPFKVLAGFLDVKTQMSLIKLKTGKFLVLDTVDLTPPIKAAIDNLTDNGTLIEAVLGTHPFHTMYFSKFYQTYPNAKYYGCPRHLRIVTDVKWAGSLNDESVRKLWEPEVEMKIPDGCEFIAPKPESYNHFVSVFVLHKPSKTLHVDDTFGYSNTSSFIKDMVGMPAKTITFHPALSVGLLPTPEAPGLFYKWLTANFVDKSHPDNWANHVDNIVAAHSACRIGGSQKAIEEAVAKVRPQLLKMAQSRGCTDL